MPDERSPKRREAPADPPSDVQISVTVAPHARARPLDGRLARALLSLALPVLVGIGVAVVLTGEGRPTGGAGAGHGELAAVAGVAAAYGYPFRCLSITFSPGDREYARAHVVQSPGCTRYHGYVNASFHRIDGNWRLTLDEGQLFVPNRLLASRAR